MDRATRTSRVGATVASALIAVLVSGCAGSGAGPFTLMAALNVPNAPSGDLLFAAGAALARGNDNAVEDAPDWYLGYREDNGDTNRYRIFPSGKVTLDDHDAAPILAKDVPVLDRRGLIDSSHALAIAQQDGAIPAESQLGDQQFYWLAADRGFPAWLITHVGYDGVRQTTLVHATTGQVFAAPTQFSFDDALAIATERASAWHPSAALMETWGLEQGMGFMTYARFNQSSTDGLMAPPDPSYVDGLAPSWTFQFAPPGGDQALFLHVLVGGLVQEGVMKIRPATPIESGAYGPQRLAQLVAPDLPNRPVAYRLSAPDGQLVWDIQLWQGDVTETHRMDSHTGTMICSPCEKPFSQE